MSDLVIATTSVTSAVAPARLNGSGRLGRITVLDGLRGYAILMVMWSHYFMGDVADEHRLAFVRWTVRAIGSGWIGVDLFFVLSGFLITNGLLETKGRPRFFLNFYGRRTLRIFPLYYGVLFVVLVVIPFVFRGGREYAGDAFEHQAWLWCYLTNFAVSYFGSYNIFKGTVFALGHFWSLAVEEHFYLIWPMVIRFVTHRALVFACFVAIAIGLGSRLWFRITLGNNDAFQPYFLTNCRIDSLATGALAAALYATMGIKRLGEFATWGVIGGGLVTIWLFWSEHGLRAVGSHLSAFNYNLFDGFFACLLLAIVAAKESRLCRLFFANRPMVAMGKYSYGIYVYHVLFARGISIWINVQSLHRFVPTVFLSRVIFGIILGGTAFACAFVSWHAYEKQFLKLKHFF